MKGKGGKLILLLAELAVLAGCVWGLYRTGFFQAGRSEAGLEAYIQGGKRMPCIILMEDPEIFLHPRLQKVAVQVYAGTSGRSS